MASIPTSTWTTAVDCDCGHYKLHEHVSNPYVMMAAGLLAKKAVEKGLRTPPWVKTSLAPGSRVVTDYYVKAGLMQYLDALRFNRWWGTAAQRASATPGRCRRTFRRPSKITTWLRFPC